MEIKGETGFKRLFKRVENSVTVHIRSRGSVHPWTETSTELQYKAFCHHSVEPFGRVVDRMVDRIFGFSTAIFRSPDSVMAGPNCATELLQNFRASAPKRENRLFFPHLSLDSYNSTSNPTFPTSI